MKKTNQSEDQKLIGVWLSSEILTHLNEMSVGNRSEFIRRLIESEYQKRREQK